MKIKKGDIIISMSLLLLSIVMAFGILNSKPKTNGRILRVEKHSELYGEYSLYEDREIVIDDGVHYNKIVIKDGEAYMDEANCRYKLSTYMPAISINGETIVCLPNRVFLEVIDTDQSNDDGIDWISR